MDIASFLGVISGISLIVSAIFIGGDINNFINIEGMMIVGGGTLATTLLTFQFKDVLAAFKAAYFVFSKEKEDPNDAVATMIKLCHLSRKQGLLELSKIKTKSGFLKKACGLISDGSSEQVIRAALLTEIDSLKLRHYIVQDVFRKMGIYSPAFGMLGTLIGLVQMLSKLQDPSSIGPAMATALLTTFYGSLMSTLLFLPIAGKLKSRTVMEVINLEIMLEGAISILDSNNPVVVYEKLSSFIPERLRKPITGMNYRSENK
ncbi:Flagellar motor protein MotA [Desulfamplus magnetovallimortis]|uniref:Flagellar motor protein MotA n=1 Tax=Desulfamplus magnetovallimortis TaxID=1246637 RepID=L0R429_9BACT|nr:MotA/TolQ/ExbB proton channel family protein [Desulfamplus magnetovallimortis]CCO06639.1 Flagellar motor protein MotA [Desulfamplus magnetovallimortis BW-1]SLM32690.1 Flagellar motor protein MotA [Desulfamplus magnetovallimortis]